MKKVIMLASSLLVLLCFTGCSNNQYIKNVNYEELTNMIEDNQSFILEVMSTDCSACQDFKPKLNEVTEEYKITVYSINIQDISSEDWTDFKSKYSVSSTPTTMFFTEGKEITVATRIEGSVSKDKIISKFKAMGYIIE